MIKYLFFFLFCSFSLFAQIYEQKDVDIFNEKIKLAKENHLAEKDISEVITAIGKSFLGVDYVAHTLEKGDKEQIVVCLSGLDCTTFMENVLEISRCIKMEKTSYEDFLNEIKNIRYRNGKIDGYTSRIHYTSDWIFENNKNGIINDITKEIGGTEYKFNLNFMSKNPHLYKQLKNDEVAAAKIKEIEQSINKRTYYYIPKAQVNKFDAKINSGDIIAIVTNLEGLDIGHVGYAVREDDGKIHFMHAPIVGSKVQITEKPLQGYLEAIKNHKGIIVLRPLNP